MFHWLFLQLHLPLLLLSPLPLFHVRTKYENRIHDKIPPAAAKVHRTELEITKDLRLVITQCYGQKQKLFCASALYFLSVITDVKTELKPANCIVSSTCSSLHPPGSCWHLRRSLAEPAEFCLCSYPSILNLLFSPRISDTPSLPMVKAQVRWFFSPKLSVEAHRLPLFWCVQLPTWTKSQL